ncbi:UBX domain-containing protein 10 [Smittium culicis]|uniref:UBX domain-containing protein 10 n=1 Tax=Smittium culicis TaxID=133412 RepID=A0A1R1YNZ9_9FUNG|nr:UBX domain-containing protein 10 [Smittium culicis]
MDSDNLNNEAVKPDSSRVSGTSARLADESSSSSSRNSQSSQTSPGQNDIDDSTNVTSASIEPGFSLLPLLFWPIYLVFAITRASFSTIMKIANLNKNSDHSSETAYSQIRNSSSFDGPSDLPESTSSSPQNSAKEWLLSLNPSNNLSFFSGDYGEALQVSKRNFQALIVILVSELKDDAKRLFPVLSNPELINYINDTNTLVYFNSVLEISGLHVAQTLMAGDMPFIAILAPKFDTETNSFKLSVVSRLDGLPTNPENDIGFVYDFINRNIERHNRILQNARREQEERARARTLREQQDLDYHASLERDRIREMELREKERLKAAKMEEKARRKENKILLNKQKRDWRVFTKNTVFNIDEPVGSPSDGVCVLSIRLEDGSRIKRKFNGSDSIETVYMYVETTKLCEEDISDFYSDFPNFSQNQNSGKFPAMPESIKNYKHKYDFNLVVPYPRSEFEPSQESIRECLQRVNMYPSALLMAESNNDDDDESSEEEGDE